MSRCIISFVFQVYLCSSRNCVFWMSCILTVFRMSLLHCWSTTFNSPDCSILLFSSSWPSCVCLNELVNSPQPEAWQCPVVQQIAMPLSPLVLDFVSWADHLLVQAFVQCSHHFCCHCFNCWFESCDLWHCHLAILCKLAKPTLFEELPFAVSISRRHTLILQKLSFSMSSTLLTAKWYSSASFFSTAARTAAGFFLLLCFQSLESDFLFSLP